MFNKNRLKKLFICYLFLVLLFMTCIANATTTLPTPTSYKYLNDYTGTLSESETKNIISIGKELEDKTGAQAIVVIINSTDGAPIEDYAIKLFRGWGIGKKNKDNGLLILLALNDKAWRVEVGRGLEGAIPDALSNRVMDSIAKPSFIDNNYGTGLLNSYSAFSDYIASEYNVTLDKSLHISLPNNPNSSVSSNRGFGIGAGIIAVLFILDIILNRGRVSSTLMQLIFISSLGRRNGPRGGGGGSSGGGGFGGFGGGSSNGGGSSGGW
ncbi:MAG: TPM domain-containing protein [Clostridium sp.]